MRAVLKASTAPDKSKWSHLTKKDFLPGSFCLNKEKSTGLLSGSTPALGVPPRTADGFGTTESVLLETVSKRIEQQFGLLEQNGQDFMWVSYDPGADYMVHTDCLLYRAGREMTAHTANPQVDRFATILISLNDEEAGLKGGETAFPNLNLSFTPKSGRVLVWWSVDPNSGVCDQMSSHVAKEVKAGRKLILMRWYQYFPVFGKHRRTPLTVKGREPFQPEVSCDVGQEGGLSCRHYAEMIHNGDGGGNVALEDMDAEDRKEEL